MCLWLNADTAGGMVAGCEGVRERHSRYGACRLLTWHKDIWK